MADFHNTLMGKKFYQADVPDLIHQLTRIANALEENKKEEEVGSKFSAIKSFVKHYPDDKELGQKIREIWN
jgi:hypothetical protein